MVKCAPHIKQMPETDSCLTHENLIDIASKLNITYKEITDIKTFLKNQSPICEDELCIVKMHAPEYIKNFRPRAPSSWKDNLNQWLSNLDIEECLKQYEMEYCNFKFLGVFPTDFESYTCTYTPEMKACIFFDKNKYIGKESFSIVINLSKTGERGSHWVCIFFNINPKSPQFGIHYYDSSGMNTINNFIKTLIKNIKTNVADENFNISRNRIKHQFGKSECGMFCIYFITNCLSNPDTKYNYICKNIKDTICDQKDANITEFRKHFFNI